MKRLLRPALTFGILLSLAGCQKQSTSGVQVSHDEAKLIPPQAKALAGVDVAALKAAPLYQQHAKVLDVPLVAEAIGNIGLDPRRDVKSLVVALSGDQAIAIASGTFSEATIQHKLSANGAQVNQYAGQKVLSSGSGAVSFLSDNLAVAGPAASLRIALDAAQSKTGGVPLPLQSRLQLLRADDQIWFVSNGPLPVERLAGASGMASTVSSLAGFVQASAVGIHMDSGLHATAHFLCTSEKGAQQVRDALRGLVGLARLTTKDGDMDVLRAYDAIQITEEAKTVHVQADLSPELSERLLTRLPALKDSVEGFAR